MLTDLFGGGGEMYGFQFYAVSVSNSMCVWFCCVLFKLE